MNLSGPITNARGETDGVLHVGNRKLNVKTLTKVKTARSLKKNGEELIKEVKKEISEEEAKSGPATKKDKLINAVMHDFDIQGASEECKMLLRKILTESMVDFAVSAIPYIGAGKEIIDGVKNSAKSVKDALRSRAASNLNEADFSDPIYYHAAMAA